MREAWALDSDETRMRETVGTNARDGYAADRLFAAHSGLSVTVYLPRASDGLWYLPRGCEGCPQRVLWAGAMARSRWPTRGCESVAKKGAGAKGAGRGGEANKARMHSVGSGSVDACVRRRGCVSRDLAGWMTESVKAGDE